MSETLISEALSGWKRTSKCAEFTKEDQDRKVTVMGWVHKRRDLGGVIFVDLRDISGIIQVVFNTKYCGNIFEKAEKIRSEYVIAVTGDISIRAPETINPNIKTGDIEIIAYEMKILSAAETPPMMVENSSDVNEATRLKYRYIDLRRHDMQANLVLRHKVCKLTRSYFDKHGFLEIETPMLTKSTPEGARDYLVPSRMHPGSFYALPQSPQLFKQLLMVSGFDRYMQITKCFRDEDLRADRQPEFTQIDLEMSFVEIDDVISVNEGFIKELFSELLRIQVNTPITRLTYKQAMTRFGSDKPDTRFGLELCDISDIVTGCGFRVFNDVLENGGSVRLINIKGGTKTYSRRDIDKLVDLSKTFGAKGMCWITVEVEEAKSPIGKFLTPEQMNSILKRAEANAGDLIIIIADNSDTVFRTLGGLRLEIGRKLGLIDESKYNFVWVTEFPLLEYDTEEKRYVAIHHPFTSPMDEDIPLLKTNPLDVRAKAYDIILNGVELGGGSIRIHDQELQTKMFSLLGFTHEEVWDRFGFLLEAFKYGTPPHGGIAYGLDRLIMLMANKSSIRDVIAFPKVQNASCLMTGAPDAVDGKQLKELYISPVTISNHADTCV